MNKHKKVWLGLVATLVLWAGASWVVGMFDLFDQPNQPPAFFGLFLAGSIVGFLSVYALSKTVREALLAIPLWAIVAVHAFRFVGFFFILDTINHVLAPQFGWPAGIGDIIAAAVSIPLTIAIKNGRRSPGLRRSFIAWNIFGLVDLFTAIVVGLLYSQSAVGILSQPGLDSQAVTHLPLSLIPTFYVPLLILLHFLALRRYREV